MSETELPPLPTPQSECVYTTPVNLKDVGITDFISDGEPFTALVKSRYEGLQTSCIGLTQILSSTR